MYQVSLRVVVLGHVCCVEAGCVFCAEVECVAELDCSGGVEGVQRSAFGTVVVVVLAYMDFFILCVIALFTKIKDVLAS